jgi:hypothetical protein
MKKFLFILFGLFVVAGAFAAGENIPTSKSYVDSKLGEKQDIIPANDGATQVLTNTGTAGEYGTKGIYDANGAYVAQTQNLVDAATMNAGVQNAIDSEFQCIEWTNPNDHTSDCLLMDVFGQTNQSILPDGFTALEYIEGGAIDTGLYIKTTDIYEFKYSIPERSTAYHFGYRGTEAYDSPNTFNGTYSNGVNNGVLYIVNNQSKVKKFSYNVPINTPFVFRWNGSVDINPTVSSNIITSVGTTSEQTNPGQTFVLGGQFIQGEVLIHKPKKLYYFKTFDSNGIDITHNFIPARRNSDGVLGMYDTVSNTFFTNAGTGEFIAGPVVNLYLPTGE